MKVILQSTEDIKGQVRAVEFVLGERKDWQPGSLVGVHVGGRMYSLRFNKGSVSVYPQSEPRP